MNAHEQTNGTVAINGSIRANGRGAARRIAALALLAAVTISVLLVWSGAARADFGIQSASGLVASDADGTPETQAGAHPYEISTTIKLNTTTATTGLPLELPDGQVKNIVVDLPPGFSGNPTAAPKCSDADFEDGLFAGACPDDTQVGYAEVYRGGLVHQTLYVRIYNLTPPAGSPARFGGRLSGYGTAAAAIVDARVRTESDYGLTVSARNIPSGVPVTGVKMAFWGVPASPAHDEMRGQCLDVYSGPTGEACPASTAQRVFLTNPAHCSAGPLTTHVAADSWEAPGRFDRTSFDHDVNGVAMQVEGCDKPSFSPTIAVRPDTTAPDAPAGYAIDLKVPQADAINQLGTPPLRKAVVTLPEGVSISPSAADGLQGCTDEQIAIGSSRDPDCPDAARIGTATIDTPLLEQPLTGSIFLGTQASDDPASGRMFRMFLVAQGSGVTVKLPGAIVPDPVTGQLTTSFDDNPQLPFSELRLRFKGGPRAPLVNPATCGTKTASAQLTSWSGRQADRQSSFEIDCAAGLGGFAPSFMAGTVQPVGGASSPFTLAIAKPDGQRDLTGLRLELPEGLLANLKGNVGTQVGTARVASGSGAQPFWLSGPVVLEGAYGDAPFSLRVTVPVVAGPFNLGNVVVRQKIYVDRHDAHVTLVSDPLPTIVSGVPVRLQRLEVDVDKPGFMVNPTSCAPKTIHAALESVAGQTAAVSSRFQVGDCASLPLTPKLALAFTGGNETKKGKHPGLDATVTQTAGQSGLKKVAVTLPLSVALDAENAQALCKPEQATARACPEASIVGKATAVTPILDQPLSGPVYFVEGLRTSSTGRVVKTLPKLMIALKGQVELDLMADSSVTDDQLVTTFGFVPDAPISSFRLQIAGGQHGILEATGTGGNNVCDAVQVAAAAFTGQNGKLLASKPKIATPCGLRVAAKSVSAAGLSVKLSGLGKGRLTVSGSGVKRTARSIRSATVATIRPRLSASGRRALASGRAVRATVSFDPAGPAKPKRLSVAVKPAKKATKSAARAAGKRR